MPKTGEVVKSLLRWYRKEARDLPWRRRADPYAIWVSEIMLQQTQVATVIPYWTRWLDTLPTIEALAKAAPDQVLKLWEGLGYYSRAKNLQRAALEIVARHDGIFPRRFDDVLALRGIGPYSAGAITSIAFGHARPIVDGNVIRVLTRFDGIVANAKQGSTNKLIWARAEELVKVAADCKGVGSRNPCGDFNQSLMELGATVCLPREPNCGACPLGETCFAHREGKTSSIPNLGERKKIVAKLKFAYVLEQRGRFLIQQRPSKAVNGDLWEFPGCEASPEDPDGGGWLNREFGVTKDTVRLMGQIKHSIMNQRITVKVYRCRELSGLGRARKSMKWVRSKELGTFAFAAAHRKIVNLLEEQALESRI